MAPCPDHLAVSHCRTFDDISYTSTWTSDPGAYSYSPSHSSVYDISYNPSKSTATAYRGAMTLDRLYAESLGDVKTSLEVMRLDFLCSPSPPAPISQGDNPLSLAHHGLSNPCSPHQSTAADEVGESGGDKPKTSSRYTSKEIAGLMHDFREEEVELICRVSQTPFRSAP